MSSYTLENRLERYKTANKQLRVINVVLLAMIAVCLLFTMLLNFNLDKASREVEELTLELETQRIYYEERELEMESNYLTSLHMMSDWESFAYTMQGEAGGEGVTGIKHCASTVINRVKTNHWGNTINDVISAPKQFAAYGQTYAIIYPEVVAAIDEVLLYGPINESIFYMNPKTASPAGVKWMHTKPYLLTYGNHEFYGS